MHQNWIYFSTLFSCIIISIDSSVKIEEKEVLKVPIGEKFEIECTVAFESKAVINYYWFHRKNEKQDFVKVAKNKIYNKEDAEIEDEGVYYCIGFNSTFNTSGPYIDLKTFDIHGSPFGKRNILYAAQGTKLQLPCDFERGKPQGKILWKHNGSVIEEVPNRIATNGFDLIIFDLLLKDQGNYSCQLAKYGSKEPEKVTQIKIGITPHFVVTPRSTTVREGTEVVLECEVTGDPQPNIKWHAPKDHYDKKRFFYSQENSLVITNSKQDDSGVYRCVAESSLGRIEMSAEVKILYNGAFASSPKNLSVVEGNVATFVCESKSNATIFWKSGDKVLASTKDDKNHLRSIFYIKSVKKSDEGTYACHINTANTKESRTARLTVQTNKLSDNLPPVIQLGSSDQIIYIGGNANLICEVDGHSNKVHISWQKNNEDLAEYDRYKILDSGTLQIKNLIIKDSGVFTCVATSKNRKTEHQITLTVSDKRVNAVREKSVDISNLPSAPSAPIAIWTNSTSIVLKWDPPPIDKSIQHYRLEFYSSTVSSWTRINYEPWKRNEYLVNGLQRGAGFRFIVRGRNKYGYGHSSPVSEKIYTFESENKVKKVDMVKLMNTGLDIHAPIVLTSTTVRISWNVMKYQNYIDRFAIKYGEMGSRVSEFKTYFVMDNHLRSTVLTGLNPWTNYNISIEPMMGLAIGIPSKSLSFETYESKPTAPPVNIMFRHNPDTNKTTVYWEPPHLLGRNGHVTKYKVYGFNPQTGREEFTETTEGLSLVLPRDTNYKNMKIKVAAVNDAGVGPYSPAVSHFQFDIPPAVRTPFFQQIWFIILIVIFCVVLSFLLVVYCLYRRRTNSIRNSGMHNKIPMRDDTTYCTSLRNLGQSQEEYLGSSPNQDWTEIAAQPPAYRQVKDHEVAVRANSGTCFVCSSPASAFCPSKQPLLGRAARYDVESAGSLSGSSGEPSPTEDGREYAEIPAKYRPLVCAALLRRTSNGSFDKASNSTMSFDSSRPAHTCVHAQNGYCNDGRRMVHTTFNPSEGPYLVYDRADNQAPHSDDDYSICNNNISEKRRLLFRV